MGGYFHEVDGGEMNNGRRIGNDRRKERYSYKQNILVDGIQLFRSIDISEGGLYVYTGRSYMQNSVVNVTLPLALHPQDLP